MKTLFRAILLLCFGAGAACIGAGIENHRALQHAKAEAGDPLSIIGVASCRDWLGVVVITKNGVIKAIPGIDPAVAQEATKALPEANSAMIHTPCGAGDTTT